MAEWAKTPDFVNWPITILVVPDADDEERVSIKLETLENLLKAAGYFRVEGKIHV